ncbi:MAG: PDC sensor domain-containing protein [Desulfobacterales bacterium]|nr:PDC sensor domain-containing protein [Desulfobacterales bacterium]
MFKRVIIFILAYAFFRVIIITGGNYHRAIAEEISMRMESIIKSHEKIIQKWVKSTIIIESVIEQNNQNQSLDEIKRIDKDWVDGKIEDFVISLQKNLAGKFLNEKIKSNAILYAEAFLCDNQGAVVGEYPKTSDYWQGDEDKFTKCFNDGHGTVYYGPIVFDESTKKNSIQISLPVTDDGKTIGVLIVGIKNIE